MYPGEGTMKKKAKKQLTAEEQLRKLKKRFYTVFGILIAIILLLSFYIFQNYDYLAFKHFITQFYIYTDTLDELYRKELKRDVKGRYFSYFDDLVISVVTKRIREENDDRYTYLYTPEHLKAYQAQEKEEALQSEIKVLNNKTLYLHITNFSKYTERFIKDHVEQLKEYPQLIIDLRDNYGGDIDAMARICNLFLTKGSTIATDKTRIFDWVYKAKKDKVLSYDRIIILQNRNTASASENMIAALKDNLDHVTLIGEKTYGKGIGQYTLPLKRGFAVKATILLWYTPKGRNIQGNGIEPDIAYTGEDAIEFALKQLHD